MELNRRRIKEWINSPTKEDQEHFYTDGVRGDLLHRRRWLTSSNNDGQAIIHVDQGDQTEFYTEGVKRSSSSEEQRTDHSRRPDDQDPSTQTVCEEIFFIGGGTTDGSST